jgi:hypothetical protein
MVAAIGQGLDHSRAVVPRRSGARAHLSMSWLPAVVTLLTLLGLLLGAGTAGWDIVRYTAYTGWAVVLPGTLLYRVLRRTAHSLLDDVAMGAALGLVLEIAALGAFSAADLRGLLWLWPAFVVVPFVAVPSLRGHWLPAYTRTAPTGWSWAVAGVSVWFLTYLTVAFLRPNQPVPTHGPQRYLIDELFFLGLVGEAKRSFPPSTPSVAGETLPYHWFSFAHMASASIISGVDVPVVVFRFAVPLLGLLAVVLLAVAGWRLTGRPWVGVGAAVLTFVVGELTAPGPDLGALGSIMTFFSWSSLSVLYSTALAIPLMVLVADRIRGVDGAVGARGGWSDWVLLGLFAFAVPGGKSTVLPVMLVGVGLVCLVQLLRRRSGPLHRRTRAAPWLVVAILLVAQVCAIVLLYRFETQTLRFEPLSILRGYLTSKYDRPWWKEAGAVGFALGGYLVCVCARLAGIPVLARLRGRTWGDTEWFLFGATAAGLGATLLLWHSSWSQLFFMVAGWPFGAVLSAAGLVALVERHRLRARTVGLIVAGTFAVAAVVPFVVWQPERPLREIGYFQLFPVYEVGAATAGIALLVALGALAVRRWRLVTGGSVAVLCVVLAAGLPRMVWDARYNANMDATTYHLVVTPAQAQGARWLRDHSAPGDLVATNTHRLPEAPPRDWSLSYWVSGFTERRMLVESWGYTTRAYREAVARGEAGTSNTFWDPRLLADNDAAILDSTPERIAWLRGRGVRWILVERRFGVESPRLRDLAELRWEREDTAVYRL